MSAFPDLPAPNDHSGYQDYDPFAENTFQSGDEQLRPQFTKPREEPFTLSWSAMNSADTAALKAHYDAHRGSSFSWVAPDDGATYTCRYVGGSFKRKPSRRFPGRYETSIAMKRII
ncbi:MAG: hypothetical protein CL942_05865 [Desulfovibrio sp.]|nr:hypothetical protein [Desulfovibrio sp.]|tara:strand:+ start:7177 stop:7524 length:348 start_codon:yes stop_codon:yes gene_type:complete